MNEKILCESFSLLNYSCLMYVVYICLYTYLYTVVVILVVCVALVIVVVIVERLMCLFMWDFFVIFISLVSFSCSFWSIISLVLLLLLLCVCDFFITAKRVDHLQWNARINNLTVCMCVCVCECVFDEQNCCRIFCFFTLSRTIVECVFIAHAVSVNAHTHSLLLWYALRITPESHRSWFMFW